MVTPLQIGEGFVLVVLTLGYVPAVRAYAAERQFPWLLAGFTALLLGRAAAVADWVVEASVLPLVEHGVGVALAGVLLAMHFYGQWRGDRRPVGVGEQDPPSADGGR